MTTAVKLLPVPASLLFSHSLDMTTAAVHIESGAAFLSKQTEALSTATAFRVIKKTLLSPK